MDIHKPANQLLFNKLYTFATLKKNKALFGFDLLLEM